MLFKIRIITLPVAIVLLILKDQGPTAKFIKAGAISPERARKPASIKVERLYLMTGAIKRGVLVALDDGRYYVDMTVYRHRRRMVIIASTLVVAALFAGALVLWR